jgi:hypothetical protein
MTSTRATCSFCGTEGYWGRFGGHRALYIRGSAYSNPFERVAWICPDCLKPITDGELLYKYYLRSTRREVKK